MVTMKQCRWCNELKALDRFPCAKKMPDGRTNKCKDCLNAHLREKYVTDNRAKDRAAAYRAANPERLKELRRRAWAKYANTDKGKAVIKENRARRDAAKKAAYPVVSLAAIRERDGLWCYLCEQTIDDERKVTIDHVVPIARGGTHTEDNLRVAHQSCNSWKHDRLLSELTLPRPEFDDESWSERVATKTAESKSKFMKDWWSDPANAEKIAARNAKTSAARTGQPWSLAQKAAQEARVVREAAEIGWAKKFDCCQGCGTSERPHKSKGLCDACYLRAYRSNLDEATRRKQVHGRTGPPQLRVPSEETKAKTSASLKLAYAEGRRQRGHSDETRRKISATKRAAALVT